MGNGEQTSCDVGCINVPPDKANSSCTGGTLPRQFALRRCRFATHLLKPDLVTKMKSSMPLAGLNQTFDKFLRAPVCEDGNGTPLSVLSALARLDIDPWKEAAELTELSPTMATQRLSLLIAALPGALSNHISPTTSAVRLIALLPHRDRSSSAVPSSGATALSAKLAFIALFMMFLSSVMASRYIESNESSVITRSDQTPPSAAVPNVKATIQGQTPHIP